MSQIHEASFKIPSSWVWVTLGEIAKIKGGITKDQKRETVKGRMVPYLRVANVQRGFLDLSEVKLIEASEDVINELSLRAGDVLFTEGGDRDKLGRGWVWNDELPECIHQNHIFCARLLNAGISPKLISWFGNSFGQQYFMKEGKQTTNLASVNLTKLKLFPVPVPPKEEQNRLVEKIEELFTQLDAGIDALAKAQALLKRYRASVLKAACEGRLVPTEAELARQEGRDYEPADRLLSRILKERRAAWEAAELEKMARKGIKPKGDAWKKKYKEPAAPKTEGLPELPEGWVWATIGYAFDVFVGATPSRNKPEYWGGDIPWVSSGEVAFCRIKQTRELITQEGFKRTSTELHPPGTILLGMIGEGKTRGQVAILDAPACHNQNSAAIQVSKAGLSPEYLYYFLVGNYEETRRKGSGGNQPALNKSRVQSMVFPLPPLEEQHRIAAELDRHFSFLERLDSELSNAWAQTSGLRQAVLHRAFQGKLVPQDHNDEPASALLERIQVARAQGTSGQSASNLKKYFSAREKTIARKSKEG